MNTSRSCEHCGVALAADARFCETCGKPVTPIAQPENSVPQAAPMVSADRPAAPVAAPPTAAPRSSNRGLMIGLAIVGVLVVFGCLAVGVVGFWFMQSKPAVTSPLPAGTSQVVVVPTYNAPTNVAPTNMPTKAPPSIAPTIQLPTSAPLATNTPSLPAGVLFLDDFASQDVSKRNGWMLASDDVADRTWAPNAYTISVKKPKYFMTAGPNGEYDNLGIETETQVVSSGYAEYGLLFRSSKTGSAFNYYMFGITTDGKYYLDKKVADKWIDPSPVDYTPSQFINQGKSKNTLGVIVQANQISLFINRVLVNKVTDDSLTGKGEVGVMVEMSDKDIATVAFSRLTVYAPDKAQAEWCPPSTTALPTGVLFNEDFSSARVSACNGWWEIVRPDYDALWSPNAFTLSIKKPNYGAIDTMDSQYADFALETEAQPLDENVNVYGLIFRFNPDQNGKLNYYRFALVPDGRYALAKLVAGEWQTRVVDYTASPAIKTGKNKNILGVIAQGNTFSLYINRTLVKTVTDDAIKGGGMVGVTIGNGTSAPAAATFSRLTVLTPDKAKADWGSAPIVTSAPTLAPRPTAPIAPGLYVTSLRFEPAPPKRGQDIGFYTTFLNTAAGDQNTRWLVYVYRPDNFRNSFGETSTAPITVPRGQLELKALGGWKLGGGGGCEDFVARVAIKDNNNQVTFLNQTDGQMFESRFSVCP